MLVRILKVQTFLERSLGMRPTRMLIVKYCTYCVLACGLALAPEVHAHDSDLSHMGEPLDPTVPIEKLNDLIDQIPGLKRPNFFERRPEQVAHEISDDEFKDAPEWALDLRDRKLRTFFRPTKDYGELQGQREVLRMALIQLHTFIASKSDEKFQKDFAEFDTFLKKDYITNNLDDAGMSVERILMGAKISFGDLALNTYLHEVHLRYLARNKPIKTVFQVVTSRGALLTYKLAAAWGAGYFAAKGIGMEQRYLDIWAAFVGGGFAAGVAGELWKNGTGFFLTPSSELLKVISSRYTYSVEAQINAFMDSFKPESTDDEDQLTINNRVRFPNLKEDGGDFANMSREDHDAAVAKYERMWVWTAKRYGQLFRDTAHAGRWLIEQAWLAELQASQSVRIALVELEVLSAQIRATRNKFQDPLLNQGRTHDAEELGKLFQRLDTLCTNAYEAVTLTTEQRQHYRHRIQHVLSEMLNRGVFWLDLQEIMLWQQKRARATQVLVTATTINEMMMLGKPEANRNLDPEARITQRVARFGLAMQDQVEQHKPQVRAVQVQMGFPNKGPMKPPACAEYLIDLTSYPSRDQRALEHAQ